MDETPREYMSFVTKAGDCPSKPLGQFIERVADRVAQLDAFEMPPYSFIGIEIWRVGGQPFQMQACGFRRGEKGTYLCAAMDRRPIPDHGDRPRHVAQQVAQERDHLCGADAVAVNLHQKASILRDPTDDRAMGPRTWSRQTRCLAPRSVGMHHCRQEVQG